MNIIIILPMSKRIILPMLCYFFILNIYEMYSVRCRSYRPNKHRVALSTATHCQLLTSYESKIMTHHSGIGSKRDNKNKRRKLTKRGKTEGKVSTKYRGTSAYEGPPWFLSAGQKES